MSKTDFKINIWASIKENVNLKTFNHLRAPCILFIDELDALCSRRENMNQELEKRIVSQFISLVDQVTF